MRVRVFTEGRDTFIKTMDGSSQLLATGWAVVCFECRQWAERCSNTQGPLRVADERQVNSGLAPCILRDPSCSKRTGVHTCTITLLLCRLCVLMRISMCVVQLPQNTGQWFVLQENVLAGSTNRKCILFLFKAYTTNISQLLFWKPQGSKCLHSKQNQCWYGHSLCLSSTMPIRPSSHSVAFKRDSEVASLEKISRLNCQGIPYLGRQRIYQQMVFCWSEWM